jgi:hypothetical protein
MPGLGNLSLSRAGEPEALAFVLRDGNDALVGAILFLDCAERPDGAEELVAALTRTAAAWIRAKRSSEG